MPEQVNYKGANGTRYVPVTLRSTLLYPNWPTRLLRKCAFPLFREGANCTYLQLHLSSSLLNDTAWSPLPFSLQPFVSPRDGQQIYASLVRRLCKVLGCFVLNAK